MNAFFYCSRPHALPRKGRRPGGVPTRKAKRRRDVDANASPARLQIGDWRRCASINTIVGMQPMLWRLMFSMSSLFFSLILGAIMLGIVGYNSPETLSYLLGKAGELKHLITGTGLDPKYNIWVEVLLEEKQLLFMFFTITARLIIGVLGMLVRALFGRR